VTRSGAFAARKSAAAVPTSGPTTWGAPRPHSSIDNIATLAGHVTEFAKILTGRHGQQLDT
jgi:hypothetical protein